MLAVDVANPSVEDRRHVVHDLLLDDSVQLVLIYELQVVPLAHFLQHLHDSLDICFISEVHVVYEHIQDDFLDIDFIAINL